MIIIPLSSLIRLKENGTSLELGKAVKKKTFYQEWGSNPRGQHVHWILSPTP